VLPRYVKQGIANSIDFILDFLPYYFTLFQTQPLYLNLYTSVLYAIFGETQSYSHFNATSTLKVNLSPYF